MKLAICGPGESGKDATALWFAANTSLRYTASTSEFAAPIVFREMRNRGIEYASVRNCWNDRRNNRELWGEIIAEHNHADPCRLYRDCLADQDLLVGMRWPHEAAACWTAGLVDLWVWIDNPRAPPDPSQRFGKEACDIVIENHDELSDLYRKLGALAKALGVLR